MTFDETITQLITPSWSRYLLEEFHAPYMQKLIAFIREERRRAEVHPLPENVFRALRETPFERVRVVILGQDPYHTPGMATGLAFSVPEATLRLPPPLQNIFKELEDDLGFAGDGVQSPDLARWARQGVLLLNTTLTVRKGEPGSHAGVGWERFTQRVVGEVSGGIAPTAFVLWGKKAQAYAPLIEKETHLVVESPQPKPFSASRGFFGSRPFSRINAFLEEAGRGTIDWQGVTGS